MAEAERKRLTVAVLAIGGQGGGVLADWIVAMAERHGYLAQGTSVPGVAQRTGSTIYYIELFPRDAAAGREPILALAPAPGDVDVVVASELMEAGRAMLRGLVTADRTTLIASTHRVYAIGEKSAPGDGRGDGGKVIDTARLRARRVIAFDMDAAAERAGSVISSVLFGALCGSRALPFLEAAFEGAIRESGIAVDANLAGFRAGKAAAARDEPEAVVAPVPLRPTTKAGRELAARVAETLPQPAHAFALEGVRRLMDYQDARYAGLYLDRLTAVAALDGVAYGWALTSETARHLALWMSYEDTIRVADLKTRASRFVRIREEARAKPDQLVAVTEYMSPRLQEVYETMPAPLGRAVRSSRLLSRLLSPLVGKGRHVRTTSVAWFLAMHVLAALRPLRRVSLRYEEEQARIEAWLEIVHEAAARDRRLALELVQCQRLIKGYGDTHAKGLASFHKVIGAYQAIRLRPDPAVAVRELREAALRDELGTALAAALERLGLAPAGHAAAMSPSGYHIEHGDRHERVVARSGVSLSTRRERCLSQQ